MKRVKEDIVLLSLILVFFNCSNLRLRGVETEGLVDLFDLKISMEGCMSTTTAQKVRVEFTNNSQQVFFINRWSLDYVFIVDSLGKVQKKRVKELAEAPSYPKFELIESGKSLKVEIDFFPLKYEVYKGRNYGIQCQYELRENWIKGSKDKNYLIGTKKSNICFFKWCEKQE